MPPQTFIPVRHYNLAATLTSGQAFRWQWRAGAWEGVIGSRWVRLREVEAGLLAETAEPVTDCYWLRTYLQTDVDLAAVLATFPQDPAMQASVVACPGLRLLRQDPWECLASFILSSTKQIVQIQQIIEMLCVRLGSPVLTPAERPLAFSFPTAHRLAACEESELRACKMGFRAPNLLATARKISRGELDLARLQSLNVSAARQELLHLPGVGEKIANCVLLFAYGFQEAFPVDVWVRRALRELYFPRRRPTARQLQKFTASYFGPYAGYAQQYLFHSIRTRGRYKKAEVRL